MGEPAIGSTLGGYRVEELIARGGMGVVYRATQVALERQVALKVIASQFAEDEEFRERFLRESRLAARLEHPNVVPVYDAREEDGELIVAMRLMEGGDLKGRISAAGPLAPAEAVELLGQVADALDAAHAAGVVHRDVKPHNILLDGGGRAYLTDFGLAKALGDSGVLRGASIAGTVEYMSPEQWRGDSVGPAADVYSLGCVMYEALTGIVPYARGDEDTEPEIPEGLEEVIERAVDKDPERRYPTAGALIEAAREREGGAPTATAVLSDAPGGPTAVIGAAPDTGRRAARARLRDRVRGTAVGMAVIAAVILAGFVASRLFPSDGPSVSEPIAVGRGPLRLATGARSLWVTSGRDGTLTKIDIAEGRVDGEPLRLEKGLSGVAVGAGSVWVASPHTREVLRIDGDFLKIQDRFEVHMRPGAVAFGGERVWVADQDGEGISAIDPAQGRILKRGIAPRQERLRLAVGAGGVWVSSASTGTVSRIGLDTALGGPPIPAGRGPSGVTVGGGIVWVADTRSEAVRRIDSATNALLGAPIQVGRRPGGIDAGTDVVWVANLADDTVSRIDIAGGEVAGEPIRVGRHPGAVAVGRSAVWVADNGDGSVTRIEP